MEPQSAKVTSSDEGLCQNQTLAYLSKWRITGLQVDVPRLFKTTFQELLLLSLLAVLAVSADILYTSSHADKKEDCVCNIIVPLGFFAFLIAVKVFETPLLQQVCSYLGLGYTGSNAAYRVAQKVLILAVVLAINSAPILINESMSTNKVPYLTIKENSKISVASAATLRMWRTYSTKLFAAYTVITFCRLYIDLAVYSYKLLTYAPASSKDDEYEAKKLGKQGAYEDQETNRNNTYINSVEMENYLLRDTSVHDNTTISSNHDIHDLANDSNQ